MIGIEDYCRDDLPAGFLVGPIHFRAVDEGQCIGRLTQFKFREREDRANRQAPGIGGK